jgi:N-acetylglucosaminyl-diphospho-decaprenol L-rhamnosyltransferase
MARVAALIVAYFSSEDVSALAHNLADPAVRGPHSVETFVIDNSGDAAEIAALASTPGVHLFLPSDTNLGYGGGMNALAKELAGDHDWLLVCNPDIRFHAGSIERLVASAESTTQGALFGPQLIGDDGLTYPSARGFPSIRTGIGHALLANIWPANPWTTRYHQSRNLSMEVDSRVDWLSGACILVRPSAFTEVGGFDDSYFMYFEDVDLAWRLKKRGWSAIYVPTARIVHSGARSTSRQATFMRRVHHQSAQRYLSRKYAGWYLAPLRWALRFALFVRREFFRI